MTIMLLAVGFVLSLSIAALQPGARNVNGMRLTSVIWTVALLAALLFTWRVIVVSHRWGSRWDDCHLSPGVRRVLPYPESFAAYDYQVPTGIFLQSFEFLNSNNVEMTGFVWQLWAGDPGSRLCGALFSGGGARGLPGRRGLAGREEDGTEQIGWYFSGTFRQNFDYRLYPFDRQDIWLRIWSPEPAEGVMPVPDFDAYRDLTPSTLPNRYPVRLRRMGSLSSAFSYDLIDYNVDFGVGTSSPTHPIPSSISISRSHVISWDRCRAPRAGRRHRHPSLLSAAADGP